MAENLLSTFEQTLIRDINSRNNFPGGPQHLYTLSEVDHFLGPNASVIHRFGNALTALKPAQLLEIRNKVQTIPLTKQSAAFNATKGLCKDFLDVEYDEFFGVNAAKEAIRESLAKAKATSESKRVLSPFRYLTNRLSDRNIVRAAGAAVIEIAAFDTLSRFSATPFFLPIFLYSGIDLRSDVPLMIQLIYHLDSTSYSPKALADSVATS